MKSHHCNNASNATRTCTPMPVTEEQTMQHEKNHAESTIRKRRNARKTTSWKNWRLWKQGKKNEKEATTRTPATGYNPDAASTNSQVDVPFTLQQKKWFVMMLQVHVAWLKTFRLWKERWLDVSRGVHTSIIPSDAVMVRYCIRNVSVSFQSPYFHTIVPWRFLWKQQWTM
jgi:hypothetical protein